MGTSNNCALRGCQKRASTGRYCSGVCRTAARQLEYRNPDLAAEIVRLYSEERLSHKATGARVGVSEPTVRHLLDRLSVRKRTLSEAKRTLTLREDSFEHLDDVATYWIGFLMADGSIGQKGLLDVGLQPADISHLQKLRRFLGDERRTISREPDRCRMVVRSQKIAGDLAHWGVVSAKSFVAEAMNGVNAWPSFWRGLFDGDGTIHKKTDVASLTSASSRLCEQFIEFVDLHCVDGPTPRIYSYRTWFRVELNLCRSLSLLALLYEEADPEVSLDRKRLAARRALNRRAEAVVIREIAS